MKMKDKINILKYFTTSLSKEERHAIIQQVSNSDELQKEFNKLKNVSALLSSKKRMPEYEIEASYLRFLKIRDKKIFKLTLSALLKYAALFILLIGISSVFYLNNKKIQRIYQAQNTTIVAENGQISKVILPDSSIVFLNSGTKLSYNSNFSINNRDLKLSGEAFFDITHNPKIPLIVDCKNIKVKVLGTRFNVNSYSDNDNIRVILERGSVELLDSKNRSLNCILKPGQMATFFKKTKNIRIKRTNTADWTTWREGKIIFSDTPMSEVIRTIKRKFNVDIKVNDVRVYNSVFNAKFNGEKLSDILNYIEYSCPIKYSYDKNNNKLITFSYKKPKKKHLPMK